MMLQCSSVTATPTLWTQSPLLTTGFLRYSTWWCPSCWGFLSPHTEQEGDVSVSTPEPQSVKGRNLWINTLTPSFLNGEIPRHVLKGLEGVWAPVVHGSYMLLSMYMPLHLPSVCCRLCSPTSWLWNKISIQEFTGKCSQDKCMWRKVGRRERVEPREKLNSHVIWKASTEPLGRSVFKVVSVGSKG